MSDKEYIRLHISPLTPNLLSTLIPASIQEEARNISYHSIQTFPEKSYGYVELPRKDAEKIRNKFQSCIIKGSKVCIETAKPVRQELLAPTSSRSSPSCRMDIDKSVLKTSLPLSSALSIIKPERRNKKKINEIPGIDIGERHVKRGWTIPASEFRKKIECKNKNMPISRMVVKSKYTPGSECLFKTILPPNIKISSSQVKDVTKSKKKRIPKETVVHEFANSTKYATFLRNDSSSNIHSKISSSTTLKHCSNTVVSKYVEGKGWFDEQGNLIEEATTPRPKRLKRSVEKSSEEKRSKKNIKITPQENSATCSSNRQVRMKEQAEPTPRLHEISDLSTRDSNSNGHLKLPCLSPTSLASSSFSSSSCKSNGSSFSIEDIDEKDDNDTKERKDQMPSCASATSKPFPPSKSSLSIQVPNIDLSRTNIIHPLASLYKKSELQEAKPLFKFFPSESEQNDDEDDDNDDQSQESRQDQLQTPMTPFTKREYERRGIRSPAPTPDTAHNPHRFIWSLDNDRDLSESCEDEHQINRNEKLADRLRNKSDNANTKINSSETTSMTSNPLVKQSLSVAGTKELESKEQEQQSDFQKWFWDNQGDINRGWKRRRKDALKEQRHRENVKNKLR